MVGDLDSRLRGILQNVMNIPMQNSP
jgi:hypothetical protein